MLFSIANSKNIATITQLILTENSTSQCHMPYLDTSVAPATSRVRGAAACTMAETVLKVTCLSLGRTKIIIHGTSPP